MVIFVLEEEDLPGWVKLQLKGIKRRQLDTGIYMVREEVVAEVNGGEVRGTQKVVACREVGSQIYKSTVFACRSRGGIGSLYFYLVNKRGNYIFHFGSFSYCILGRGLNLEPRAVGLIRPTSRVRCPRLHSEAPRSIQT